MLLRLLPWWLLLGGCWWPLGEILQTLRLGV